MLLHSKTAPRDCTPSDDSFTNLASGNEYSLIISGKGTGDPTGTSYVLGNLSVTGAVPEANTVTMMIAGLGFLALCGWRRRAY